MMKTREPKEAILPEEAKTQKAATQTQTAKRERGRWAPKKKQLKLKQAVGIEYDPTLYIPPGRCRAYIY